MPRGSSRSFREGGAAPGTAYGEAEPTVPVTRPPAQSRLRQPAPEQRRSRRTPIGTYTPVRPGRAAALGKALLCALAGALLTAVLATVLWWPRTEVTYRSSAPSSIAYADGSAHFLGLVHTYSPSGRQSYRMVVGRDPGLSYGHWLDVDAALGRSGIEAVTWTESGVRVRFPSGHEVFVPARSFLGGR